MWILKLKIILFVDISKCDSFFKTIIKENTLIETNVSRYIYIYDINITLFVLIYVSYSYFYFILFKISLFISSDIFKIKKFKICFGPY